MTSVLEATLAELKQARARSSKIIVAWSGGKDSQIILDLCARTFEEVTLLHLYVIPGLQVVERAVERVRLRHRNITGVLYLPSLQAFAAVKEGLFRDADAEMAAALPDLSRHDVYLMAMAEAGVDLIAHGAKKADGFWRRRYFYLTRGWEEMIYPLKEWTTRDVFGYLTAQGISADECLPDLNVSMRSILWMHDNHPEDYARLLEFYPYAEAVVWRRKFYGLAEENTKDKQVKAHLKGKGHGAGSDKAETVDPRAHGGKTSRAGGPTRQETEGGEG